MLKIFYLSQSMLKTDLGTLSCQIDVSGLIQGVGFRPFIYSLASSLNLFGTVKNTSLGVCISIKGESGAIETFIQKIRHEPPKQAIVESIEVTQIDKLHCDSFQIIQSSSSQAVDTFIPKDVAICMPCYKEFKDPQNRRYRYPFITCSECGPRFTILRQLPFDRENTAMSAFPMCSECLAEYQNPGDRRFHAQTISCENCGPELSFYDSKAHLISNGTDALDKAIDLLENSKILALKGIGGFQLLVDANNHKAVSRLRRVKRRPEKALAMMLDSIAKAENLASLSPLEKKALQSSLAPILLVDKKRGYNDIAKNVAPDLASWGLMLPYTAVHYLILEKLQRPLVVTSANISSEPIVTEINSLHGLADGFLSHNREIIHHADDPVCREIAGKICCFRSGRGNAPLSLSVEKETASLAFGSDLKNTFAITNNGKTYLSQHIGDLKSLQTSQVLEKEISAYLKLLNCKPETFLYDQHPDYISSSLAQKKKGKHSRIQHHQAHILACACEHKFRGSALGIAWDGMGYAEDDIVWGGEFFSFEKGRMQRVGSFLPFPLVGGDKAAREPYRVALALEHCLGRELKNRYSSEKEKMLIQCLELGKYQKTSSVGRLFDAVASLLGIKHCCSYEGQAAMMLEGICDPSVKYTYDFEIQTQKGFYQVDWKPIIQGILDDKEKEKPSLIASKFHHTMAAIVFSMAALTGDSSILFSGGVFQNKRLCECIHEKNIQGLKLLFHEKLPTNDGGIAVGQAFYHNLKKDSICV
jgi:hydrogenase maturation protein HypF